MHQCKGNEPPPPTAFATVLSYIGLGSNPSPPPQQVQEISFNDELRTAVEQSLSGDVVAIHAYLDCSEICAKMEEIAKMYTTSCFAFNAAIHKDLAQDCQIKTLPTVLLFKRGQLESRIKGKNLAKLDEEMERLQAM